MDKNLEHLLSMKPLKDLVEIREYLNNIISTRSRHDKVMDGFEVPITLTERLAIFQLKTKLNDSILNILRYECSEDFIVKTVGNYYTVFLNNYGEGFINVGPYVRFDVSDYLRELCKSRNFTSQEAAEKDAMNELMLHSLKECKAALTSLGVSDKIKDNAENVYAALLYATVLDFENERLCDLVRNTTYSSLLTLPSVIDNILTNMSTLLEYKFDTSKVATLKASADIRKSKDSLGL